MSKTLDHIYPKQQLIQYGLYILPLPSDYTGAL